MTKGLKDSADSENEIKSELVRQLATILDETDLSEIEYDTGSLRIRVARQIRESSVVMTAATRSAGVATAIPVNEVEGGATDPATHPGAVKAPHGRGCLSFCRTKFSSIRKSWRQSNRRPNLVTDRSYEDIQSGSRSKEWNNCFNSGFRWPTN